MTMKNKWFQWKKTAALLGSLCFLFGTTALAAPAVEGDESAAAVKDEIVSAKYTVTSDEDMEAATLTLSYDKNMLSYMSGSGGNNFAGSGGNGTVQLSSKPGSKETTFEVRFKGLADGDTELTVTACTVTIGGEEWDALAGMTVAEVEESGEGGEDLEELERASFVIDGRTFYVRSPGSLSDDFDSVHLDIQGYDCRVLKHNTLELYAVRLVSDNGSFRDHFVYNPETGNVVPFVQKSAGTDEVIFIEPDEDCYVPTRYIHVDMGWGQKYTIPALKHVIIDGVDEILDDTNRYLVYGINQDGEKAWYSYDYDKDSLQLFDEVAYQGEQDVILDLEDKVAGLNSEGVHQLERYNRDMGRRLGIILAMTLVIFVLLNIIVFLFFRMRRMEAAEEDDKGDEEPGDSLKTESGAFITGNLEEDETDFHSPSSGSDLEIIDLDELDRRS